jgi:hypothetical protein
LMTNEIFLLVFFLRFIFLSELVDKFFFHEYIKL